MWLFRFKPPFLDVWVSLPARCHQQLTNRPWPSKTQHFCWWILAFCHVAIDQLTYNGPSRYFPASLQIVGYWVIISFCWWVSRLMQGPYNVVPHSDKLCCMIRPTVDFGIHLQSDGLRNHLLTGRHHTPHCNTKWAVVKTIYEYRAVSIPGHGWWFLCRIIPDWVIHWQFWTQLNLSGW